MSWLAAIKAYYQQHTDKTVIIGSGFLASSFGLDGPHKAQLDAISADKPMMIFDEGMHGAWLNSAALNALNITSMTPDPAPGFDYYKRDESGEPTGYLLEGTAWQALEKLRGANLETMVQGTAEVIKLYNRYGVTTLFDAGPWEAEDTQVEILRQLNKAGQLSMRVHGSQYIDNPQTLNTIVDEVLQLKQQTQNTPYRIDTLKIMVDGTVEGRTAAMFSAYQGEPNNFGETVLSASELNVLVYRAVQNNLDIHFHALGDRAITLSLDAIEAAKKKMPKADSRFTISHIQIMADSDIARFAKMGVIAQGSLLWTFHDAEGEKFLNEDQFNRYYRYQSLLDAGVSLTFGCDFPSHGGGLEAVAPLYNMEVGHTRQRAGEPGADIQPLKSERLDMASLIRGYTLSGAYQMRIDDQVGSIEVGKKADFALLNANPFEVEPHKIHAIKVLATWFNGDKVFAAE